MKLDLERRFYDFRFHIANGSLEEEIMRKLNLPYHQKFDSDAFAFTLEKLLGDCRYVDAYKYLSDTLSSVDDRCTNTYRLWSYILQGDSERAIHLANRMIKSLGHGIHRDEALVFRYGILGGDYVETDYAKQNPYFTNMLYDKRAAIIGPANDPDLDLEAISRHHDVIGILNYSKEGSIKQYKANPNCKVITYYNLDNFLKILNLIGDNQTIFTEPDAVVLKRSREIASLNQDIQAELRGSGRIRRKLGMRWLAYYGHPNMIQLAAFDLLQFKPQSIDIYGCNFFLDKRRYREDYFGNDYRIGNKELIKSMAKHNQIFQYQILFYLYKHNRINPDNMLKNILDLGVEGFCAETEQFLST